MPLPPIQALGALAAAAPLADAAISGVTDTFAALLNAATNRGGDHPTATGNSSGIGVAESVDATGDSRLKAQTESLLQQFHQLLTRLMEDQDIEPGSEFRLQAGAAGQIQIAGSPATSPQIQNLMATSPELKQLFNSIVANVNLLRLVEESTTGVNASQPTNGHQPSPVTVVVDAERATLA